MRPLHLGFTLVVCVLVPSVLHARAGVNQRRFDLRDDIGLARFHTVALSPRRDFVLVQLEQASLVDGLIHDSLLLYKMADVRRALRANQTVLSVAPVWKIEKATRDNGGNLERLSRIRWLPDSSTFAFLWLEGAYRHRLLLGDVALKRVIPLSPASQDVLGYDIRDRSHYVYSAASPTAAAAVKSETDAAFRVGTGHSLEELAFPAESAHFIQRGELWAATGGKPRPIDDPATGHPVPLFSDSNESLTLSPDGARVAVLRAVKDVPQDWIARFPPPYPGSAYGLRAHHQNLDAPYDSWSYVSEWVSIRLSDGAVTSLTDAPAAVRAGWWEVYTSQAAWSPDSTTVLLPGTFSSHLAGEEDRPCILAVSLITHISECVAPLKRQLANGYESGWASIDGLSFASGNKDEVRLRHDDSDTGHGMDSIYDRSGAGQWRLLRSEPESAPPGSVSVTVQESFQSPPRLIATDQTNGRSAVLLDPNLRLRSVERGATDTYSWHDRTGRSWTGILYKPVGFVSGERYPLVIQTHGFSLDRFLPSGGFPSAFAAEELASAGFLVLQVRDCAGRSTPLEGPCNVAGYEGAVAQLDREGLVDASHIGIIGFSRTVFYVLEALTTSRLHFEAASITDGINLGYMNYLAEVGLPAVFNAEAVDMIGAPPYGAGLSKWIDASPEFHLDRVTTPLRVVATRGPGVVEMWEPYALLEAMAKPVDLIILNTRQHVLADPRMRLIAQGGNVDWFRFWLQGYEDPDPRKRAQYTRWRALRDYGAEP